MVTQVLGIRSCTFGVGGAYQAYHMLDTGFCSKQYTMRPSRPEIFLTIVPAYPGFVQTQDLFLIPLPSDDPGQVTIFGDNKSKF